jgi:hypothetical protein
MGNKLYKAAEYMLLKCALWKIFIVYFILIMTCGVLPIYLDTKMFSWFYIFIPLLLSFSFTYLHYFARYANSFHEDLKLIEEKAIAATTAFELLTVKAELIKFAQKRCAFRQQGDAVRIVLAKVKARLEYEFKLDTK